MMRLTHLLNIKYPYATYLYQYDELIRHPQNSDEAIRCVRADEIYDVLLSMSLDQAEKVVRVTHLNEDVLTLLLNALAVQDKKEFLSLLSPANISKSFYRAIALGIQEQETTDLLLELFEYLFSGKILMDDLQFAVMSLNKSHSSISIVNKEITDSSEYTQQQFNSEQEFLYLLFQHSDTESQQHILEKGYGCYDWAELLTFHIASAVNAYKRFDGLLNDYEEGAFDILLRERDGFIKIKTYNEDKDEEFVICLRNIIDIILSTDNETDKDVIAINEEDQHLSNDTPEDESFVDCFMQPGAPLSYPYLIKIARALANIESKKQYLKSSDVAAFCWFFNNGVNESHKQIDFNNKIDWLGDIESFKYLIKLLYDKPNNQSKTKRFNLPSGTSKRVLSVFDFIGKRSTRSTDGQYATQTFNNAHTTREDRDLLNEIVVHLLPWDVKNVK